MRRSLNHKVTGFTALLLLAFGALSSCFYLYSYREGVRKELTARGVTMAESLAMSVDEGLASENVDLISHINKISYAQDVVLAQVFSTVWIAYDAYPKNEMGVPPSERAVQYFKGHQKTLFFDDGTHVEFYSPVFYHDYNKSQDSRFIIGYVRLQLSPAQANAALGRAIIVNVLLFLVLTAVMIAILTTCIRRTVLTPLVSLQRSVGRSLNDELPQKVPVGEDDELGVLSRSFNKMCDALEQREASLNEQKALLEEEVLERMSAQDALLEQAGHLEEEVRERQAREAELEAKNAELERFTYTVSHDLKSPLITIKGFAGAVLKDLAVRRYNRMDGDLRRVMDAADKMGLLLNDLLELSRIGRITNPPVPVDMNALAAEVLAQLSGPISQSGAQITVQPELPEVYADRPRIAEVLQNLVENAIKYRGDRSPVAIEIGSREPDGKPVFFVRDNGLGIAPEYQETVFGLFNKLDARTEGTGIGLALVRRIIDFHGGRIWVESEGVGMGSTFVFTLPGAPAPAATTAGGET
ncbi:ATP-binding protein [Geomesophilobacter sediminis]|uniref:histidine kinase n=1 Tax=Geomesophilobacter sediminis TaxID=2798584 RepID=A0A8J7IPA6_9BACT|nr:ATP-binding protein [Geomesophilobacter sediminis]MBJ6724129.1 HAMP domain-containing protein [Geomesophilobacter sediminis]